MLAHLTGPLLYAAGTRRHLFSLDTLKEFRMLFFLLASLCAVLAICLYLAASIRALPMW